MKFYRSALWVLLLAITACRESTEDEAKGSIRSEESRLVDRAYGVRSFDESKSLNSESAVSVKSDEEMVREIKDFSKFVNKYTDSEGSRRLKNILANSPDRVKLVTKLMKNYSGEYPARGASVLSMAMREWPGEYTSAVMKGLDPSLQKRMISTHAAVQQIQGGEDGLRAMYMALESGEIRNEVAQYMAIHGYEKNGIDGALATISNLQFQPEKNQAILQVLSKINSKIIFSGLMGKMSEKVAFSSESYQQIEKFTDGWQNAKGIREYMNKMSNR